MTRHGGTPHYWAALGYGRYPDVTRRRYPVHTRPQSLTICSVDSEVPLIGCRIRSQSGRCHITSSISTVVRLWRYAPFLTSPYNSKLRTTRRFLSHVQGRLSLPACRWLGYSHESSRIFLPPDTTDPENGGFFLADTAPHPGHICCISYARPATCLNTSETPTDRPLLPRWVNSQTEPVARVSLSSCR